MVKGAISKIVRGGGARRSGGYEVSIPDAPKRGTKWGELGGCGWGGGLVGLGRVALSPSDMGSASRVE